MTIRKVVVATCIAALASIAAFAQSGGSYQITQSVIAGGGGDAAGGTFGLTGTSGQATVGTNTVGGSFAIRPGFWQPAFSPTAAAVGVSGQVVDQTGSPLRNIKVSISDGGVTRIALTNAFGYFRFDDVPSGQTYILQASARARIFSPVVLTVSDEIGGIVIRSEN